VVQDRNIRHYYITEPELIMLEAAPEGFERTWFGIAVGATVTSGLTDYSLSSQVSPFAHGVIITGFWGSLVMCVYFGWKAVRTRSVTRGIADRVRERPEEGEERPTSPPRQRLRFQKPWARG
jgi:hypothetical protein